MHGECVEVCEGQMREKGLVGVEEEEERRRKKKKKSSIADVTKIDFYGK